jgi:hypothetical protein
MRVVRRISAVAALLIVAAGGLALAIYLPTVVIGPSSFEGLKDAELWKAVNDSRSSIRSAVVSMLGTSVFGIAGLVGLLTYRSSQRDAHQQVLKSQNDSFATAMDLIGGDADAGSVAGLALASRVGRDRAELGEAVCGAAFTLIRGRLKMAARLQATNANRSIPLLVDRDPVGAAALAALGSIGTNHATNPTTGMILSRQCDECDLRRWHAAGLRFEVINFAGCLFWDARLANVIFERCALIGSQWHGAVLEDVTFMDCDVTFVDWTVTDVSRVTFDRCIGAPPAA